MRILYILHQFYPEFGGGTERVTLNLARAMQRAGHYAHILACTLESPNSDSEAPLKGAVHFVYQGLPVTLISHEYLPETVDFSFETSKPLVENLITWMDDEGFEVAHVTHSMRMGSALLAIQRLGIPYLATLTDFYFACYRVNLVDHLNQICLGPDQGVKCGNTCLTYPWTQEGLVGRYQQALSILNGAGDLVCPSEYVAAHFRNIFPELTFRVIPHGIDMLALGERKVSWPVMMPPEVLRLGFIGSIVPEKGLDILLHALAKVPDAKIQLCVIGGIYHSNSYVSELKRLVSNDSRVEYLGYLSSEMVYREFREFDVLCVPSRVPESFSLVLHEAMVVGVPALVSNLGAPAERISQHGGGRVLPVDDVDAWASALVELINDPQIVGRWRGELNLPLRVEEEAFFYESLYRRLHFASRSKR